MIEIFKILGLYSKLYQINRASVLKHITLTSQNCIENIGNGFVHGKYIILTLFVIILSGLLCKSNHTCEDLKVTILKGPIYNISDRQIEEQRLISLFNGDNGVSEGLNRDEAFLKHYIRS